MDSIDKCMHSDTSIVLRRGLVDIILVYKQSRHQLTTLFNLRVREGPSHRLRSCWSSIRCVVRIHRDGLRTFVGEPIFSCFRAQSRSSADTSTRRTVQSTPMMEERQTKARAEKPGAKSPIRTRKVVTTASGWTGRPCGVQQGLLSNLAKSSMSAEMPTATPYQ